MTVEQMIALLGQFDPQSRVVMEVGVHVFEPTVGLLEDDGFFKNYTTDANYGDVVIQKERKIMKPETTTILYQTAGLLNQLRTILDDYMYRSGGIPDEDLAYCRKVYDSICKTLDLL